MADLMKTERIWLCGDAEGMRACFLMHENIKDVSCLGYT